MRNVHPRRESGRSSHCTHPHARRRRSDTAQTTTVASETHHLSRETTARMMTTNRGPPRARSAAATVCGRALSAMLLLSLQAGASSSGSRSPTFTTSRAAPELAFCTPLSPRCFPGRTGASEQAAVRGPVHMALTDNASGASPVITPRKHLGPTAEEIVAARRQDALARKSEVLSSWRCECFSAGLPPDCRVFLSAALRGVRRAIPASASARALTLHAPRVLS